MLRRALSVTLLTSISQASVYSTARPFLTVLLAHTTTVLLLTFALSAILNFRFTTKFVGLSVEMALWC